MAALLVGASGVPPHATRASAPPGIEERASKVGDAAPPVSSGAFSLGDRLRRGPVVLVFYRGS